jgi:hypothetical protein
MDDNKNNIFKLLRKNDDKYLSFSKKFHLITRFMQSGKTKYMQDEIKKLLNESNSFHIILCSNSLFLTDQTAGRINNTYSQNYEELISKISDKNDIDFIQKLKPIILSSMSKNCRNLGDLSTLFFGRNKDANSYGSLMCCTNKTRLENLTVILNMLGAMGKNVTLWIDEVHTSFLTFVENYYSEYSNIECVNKIIGVTATPEPIMGFFKKQHLQINVLKCLACDPKLYYGYDDCIKQEHDISNSDYIVPDCLKINEYKVKKHKENIIKGTGIQYCNDINSALYINTIIEKKILKYNNADIIFAPGSKYVKSHNAIKDVLLDKGFYVFIFNSKKKGLYFSKDNYMDLNDIIPKEESNKKLHLGYYMGKIKHLFSMVDKPIAITGYLSIGQGITLCDWNTNFYITKAILSYKDADSVFTIQVAGRSFGNTKHKVCRSLEVYGRPKFFRKLEGSIEYGSISEIAKKLNKEKFNPDEIKRHIEDRLIEKGYLKQNESESDNEINNEVIECFNSNIEIKTLTKKDIKIIKQYRNDKGKGPNKRGAKYKFLFEKNNHLKHYLNQNLGEFIGTCVKIDGCADTYKKWVQQVFQNNNLKKPPATQKKVYLKLINDNNDKLYKFYIDLYIGSPNYGKLAIFSCDIGYN